MRTSTKTTLIAGALLIGATGTSFAAGSLAGKWKRSNGTIIQYSGSGKTLCGKVLNKKYKGKSIGCMTGANGKYRGKVKKLDEGKTYAGKASVNGNKLKLTGCVAGGLICKSETLTRQ